MKRYAMMMDCGCCEDSDIYFESDEKALQAIREIGLTNGGVLIDAKGVKHEGLDTFYGIWLVEGN